MSTAKKTPQKNTLTIQSSDPVLTYCNNVLSSTIVAGESVRLACKRHLADLVHGPERGLKWDLQAALRTISFFPEVLRLAEGEFAGKPFELGLWQKFIVGSLFGWQSSDGYRRFRTAYIEIGKGNGKSPLAGGIGLYMMNADREIGAHCFAAAVTGSTRLLA
jgi:phage terminase large subunit-like protein